MYSGSSRGPCIGIIYTHPSRVGGIQSIIFFLYGIICLGFFSLPSQPAQPPPPPATWPAGAPWRAALPAATATAAAAASMAGRPPALPLSSFLPLSSAPGSPAPGAWIQGVQGAAGSARPPYAAALVAPAPGVASGAVAAPAAGAAGGGAPAGPAVAAGATFRLYSPAPGAAIQGDQGAGGEVVLAAAAPGPAPRTLLYAPALFHRV